MRCEPTCRRDAAEMMRPRCGRDSETEVVVRPDCRRARRRQHSVTPTTGQATPPRARQWRRRRRRRRRAPSTTRRTTSCSRCGWPRRQRGGAPTRRRSSPPRRRPVRRGAAPRCSPSSVRVPCCSCRRRCCAVGCVRWRRREAGCRRHPVCVADLCLVPSETCPGTSPLQAQLRDLRTAATAATALAGGGAGGTGAGSGGSGGGEGGDAEAVRVLQGKLSALTARLADRTSLGEGG